MKWRNNSQYFLFRYLHLTSWMTNWPTWVWMNATRWSKNYMTHQHAEARNHLTISPKNISVQKHLISKVCQKGRTTVEWTWWRYYANAICTGAPQIAKTTTEYACLKWALITCWQKKSLLSRIFWIESSEVIDKVHFICLTHAMSLYTKRTMRPTPKTAAEADGLSVLQQLQHAIMVVKAESWREY